MTPHFKILVLMSLQASSVIFLGIASIKNSITTMRLAKRVRDLENKQ